MSKGSKIVPVRIPAEVLEVIEAALASRNERVAAAPWTVSDFVRDCIAERLSKAIRRRRSRAKKGGEGG